MAGENLSMWLVLPVVLLAVLGVAEALALRRGNVALHRLGIPLASWRDRLDVAVPPSLAPRPFPARDDIARGTALDDTDDIRVRWLGDHLLAFWRERDGARSAMPLALALVVIERSATDPHSTLWVSSRARLTPWLAIPTMLWCAWNVAPPPEVLALFGGGGVLLLGVSTWAAHRRLRTDFTTVRHELITRVKSGESWIGRDELEAAVGRNLLDRLP